MQPRLLRHAFRPGYLRVAAPADLDAAEQVGLGTRHPIQERRAEGCLGEDLGIGMEAQRGAAAVLHRSGILDRPLRHAPAVALAIEAPVARNFDLERIRQRVDHRDADPVQTARGLVDVAAEFAARMQHGQDDFERRFVGKTRMWIDRDAAAVIAHRHPARRAELDLDAVGVAGDGLVHRIVERLGGEMVQCPLVRAADIHAGPSPHRLQPLEDLDVLRRVALGRRCG